MRFGSFVFSISADPEKDHQVIERTLHEVELAEQAGFDAVWLTEIMMVIRANTNATTIMIAERVAAWMK